MRYSFINALVRKQQVMSAVILRDMRTRFFNHGLGFALVPLWPFVHIGVLIIIRTVTDRIAPYGDGTAVFYATGLVPTLMFSYVSRFMGLSLVMNKPMLAFPAVHIMDVMMGRACLELAGACITLFLMISILWLLGQNPFPIDINQAIFCYFSTMLLALGCGTLVGIASLVMPIMVTVYALIIIILYLSSGTLFVASNLPAGIGEALAFNPLLICVEWMRTAFYASYSDRLVDRFYVLAWGVSTLAAGLTIERVFRRQLLEA
ncbi:ABC transporter permease [Rhizobium hainanense]|uniref:Capsular polysaccharide transport system permease protein n=1 Tax=Rhizobium hainanense TaxID=52131 RepID=A0A1C3W1Z8_9HYPH|nr:capsular biosynthesis protein [Rhizobium hainanense]SCB33966.1 capsular polysaccharide transport system permease protein [Rhizobium hainanense]